MQTEPKSRAELSLKTLVPFLVLAFGFTWGIAAVLVLFADQVVAIFGEIDMGNPLYMLAVYSPAIAAVLLIGRAHGMAGLGRFFRRLTLWRAPAPWWGFLILGVPVLAYIAAALNGTIDDPFPFSSGSEILAAVALAFFLGPIEEFGWRGLALPLLQRRYAPFWASLILGIIWATWHLPAFLLSGTPYGSWSVAPWFAGAVALSFIVTPMFNDSRGSLLLSYLFHFQIMNPIFPDGQPWDSLVFGIAAVVIVWLKRDSMFQRGAGSTEIMMPEEGASA